MRTAFFDYFNRGIAEGLTPAESYRWAITEDLYSADGIPLERGQATANGMCYHPQYAAVNMDPADRWRGQRQCIAYDEINRVSCSA
jgi:hypothetical protein